MTPLHESRTTRLWGWIKMMMISIYVYFSYLFYAVFTTSFMRLWFYPKTVRNSFLVLIISRQIVGDCWLYFMWTWPTRHCPNLLISVDKHQHLLLERGIKVWAELLASLQSLVCIEKCTRNVITPYEVKPLVGPCPTVKNATMPIICFGCWWTKRLFR